MPRTKDGRPRNAELDEALLTATRRQLAEFGYVGLSLAAIAHEAGTTRPAIYRRWRSKEALVESAMASFPTDKALPPGTDPFRDLVAELTDFRRGVSMPGRLSLVGTMLQATTEPNARESYRARVIAPRRARLRSILERAISQGDLDADADLEIALTMLTGSWYGRCLATDDEPGEWPERTAALVWRALGGTPRHKQGA